MALVSTLQLQLWERLGILGCRVCASEQCALERDLPSRLPRSQEPRLKSSCPVNLPSARSASVRWTRLERSSIDGTRTDSPHCRMSLGHPDYSGMLSLIQVRKGSPAILPCGERSEQNRKRLSHSFCQFLLDMQEGADQISSQHNMCSFKTAQARS